MEQGINKNQIIAQLTRSPHGNLKEYVPLMSQAVAEEPEFCAHLISWNRDNGQIRDSKVALPVLALQTNGTPEFRSNALAHLAKLDPRNLVKALNFAREANWHRQVLTRFVRRYLRHREENWALWERTALQHRVSMKTLYARYHVHPSAMADQILFKSDYPAGTVFEKVAQLKNMSPTEAAGTILEKRIPFLTAQAALGAKMKEEAVVLALIERMSPTELVTNSKALERLGVKTVPALRAAYDEALVRATKSKKNVLKTGRAAEAVGGTLGKKLRAAQEKQLDSTSVEGDWLVLGDRSPSMEHAIEQAVMVAAILARMAKGQVHLIFFDGSIHRTIDATGKSYEELQQLTKHMTAGGSGTCIGCGLQYLLDKGQEVAGIAIVSDSIENTPPMFPEVYRKYCARLGKDVPVYLYLCFTRYTDYGGLVDTMKINGLDMQVFDIRKGVDYYSLPNLVATMRTNRYSFIAEVMATPLLDLDVVLPVRKEMPC